MVQWIVKALSADAKGNVSDCIEKLEGPVETLQREDLIAYNPVQPQLRNC